jgi:hypothetical protein
MKNTVFTIKDFEWRNNFCPESEFTLIKGYLKSARKYSRELGSNLSLDAMENEVLILRANRKSGDLLSSLLVQDVKTRKNIWVGANYVIRSELTEK